MKEWIKAIVPRQARFVLRRGLYESRICMRRVTSKFRSFPDFIIIGAMKAGTTSLFEYLSQHPQVLPSRIKEVFFFNKHYVKGISWYREHFPLKLTKRILRNVITGEATPNYLFDQWVPERIHKIIPDVKLIVLLRNPTERAISEYFHYVRKKRETRSIVSALTVSEKQDHQTDRQKITAGSNPTDFTYLGKSLYKEQLERYFQYFTRDQILVINSESFFAEPSETLKTVFQFLEIEPYEIPDLSPKHVSTNRTDVEPEVYKGLNDYFASHNQELYQLLDKNFEW